jgi:hypothetical protein
MNAKIFWVAGLALLASAGCSSSDAVDGNAVIADAGNDALVAPDTALADSGAPVDTGSAPDTGAAVDTGSAADAAPEASTKPAATLKVIVPASYTGKAKSFYVVLSPSVPLAGPPSAVLYQAMSPTFTAGQPIDVSGDPGVAKGDFYVTVVLLQEGGGSLSPKAGIDYTVSSATKFTFAGKSLDLGTLTLALAK